MSTEIYLQIFTILLIVFIFVMTRYKVTSKSSHTGQVVVDSCGLIDGRIIDLAQMGFLPKHVVVPHFILRELQMLADGSDSAKRERARYGLDVVKSLQSAPGLKLSLSSDYMHDTGKTDDKLIKYAKKYGASLYTTDFNLEKVASLDGVRVLNVNELAQKLRPSALPGEKIAIHILQKGSNRGQGVGYLDNGTMVVVDQAQHLVGKLVEVEVDRMHETASGKMIFAKLIDAQKKAPTTQTPRLKQRRKPAVQRPRT